MCQREDNRDRHNAEDFEIDPNIACLRAPDNFIQCSQHEEKQCPAEGQFLPAFIGEAEHAAHHKGEQWFAKGQTAEQHQPEERVHDGRLQFDEEIILPVKRQPAEDQHDDGRYQWHDRPLLEENA